MDGLGLASAGRALNNVRTQRGGNTGVRGVPTGMKWNAVEWWNTAEHAPAFLLSPPYPSIGFFSFPSSPFSIRLFLSSSLFSWSLSRTGSLCYSFSLASYVRNEPQLIHHNRFTCMSAGNFHRVFLLSLSLSLSLSLLLSLTLLLTRSDVPSFPLLSTLVSAMPLDVSLSPRFTWNKYRFVL